jgi:two-component system, sensor histidine kinase PdtaS
MPDAEQLRHEIEERKRAEEQVRQLNAELERRVRERTIKLESANAHLAELSATLDKAQIIIQGLDGAILFWNSGAEALYGWTREEALGRKSHELLETELPRPFEEIQAELLAHGSWTGEFRQRCRDGSILWVASYWALHRDARGRPISVVKANNDITALKRTDEALRASEATARSLFENASQGILTTDRHGRIVDANAMAEDLFGYTRAELVGSSVDMLLPESLRGRHVNQRAAFARQPYVRPMGQGRELIGRRKDGSEFPAEISLSYVAEPRTGGLALAFISDITARKHAEEERESLIARLESALSEKTVLLKEVHHRVKNNLAVIGGLLEMQADSLEDERAIIALGESQRRVMSMALIHEYLYATEHLDRVNFGRYVEQLSNQLCATYAIESDLVNVIIDAEEIDLPVHRAIPCGLILNELLSNALKYGFPDGRSGQIEVTFARVNATELRLSCSDNGIGIPAGFDWQNPKSLGLRIVAILAKQIDGKLTLDRTRSGTRFDLLFLARNAEEASRMGA